MPVVTDPNMPDDTFVVTSAPNEALTGDSIAMAVDLLRDQADPGQPIKASWSDAVKDSRAYPQLEILKSFIKELSKDIEDFDEEDPLKILMRLRDELATWKRRAQQKRINKDDRDW